MAGFFDRFKRKKETAPDAAPALPEPAAAAAPEPAAPPVSAPKAAAQTEDADDYDPMLDLPGFAQETMDVSSMQDEIDLLADFDVDAEASDDGAEADSPAADAPLDELDLDSQIEQMLRAEANADDIFNDVTRMEGLVQDKAIYDGDLSNDDENGASWSSYGKKSVKIKAATLMSASDKAAMPVYQACIIGVIAVALILGMGYTAIVTAGTILDRREEAALISHYTSIVQPVNVPNNANFIFINEHAELSGRPFTLSKISAGSTGTYFYFNQNFDPDEYAIALYDQTQTLFQRSHFDMAGSTEDGTILKFDRLNTTTIFLNLFIQDIRTQEAVTFFYRFEELPTMVPSIYLNEPVSLFESGGMDFYIDHARFDNAGSEIFYRFNSDGGTGEIRFGESNDSRSFMQVTEGIHPLPGMTVNPAEARFDEQGVILGKLNLAPVRNLRSNLEITLSDLFYRFPMPRREIDMAALFARRPEEQVFHVRGHQLALEGMAMQGDYIVLVLHGRDGENNRLETRIDATLTVKTADGAVTLAGENLSGSGGTDVLFDLLPYRTQLFGIPLSQYRLTIHAVEYKIPRFTVNLDLSNHMSTPERRLEAAERVILDAFVSRLRYKSNEIPRGEITGFSDDVLSNRALMRQYTPTGAEAAPMYAAHIVSSMLMPDNTLIAVVEDEWIVGIGSGEMSHLRQTHKVVAERTAGGTWLVVRDEVI
jgi:hypothetical protein